ncbi:MAG: HPr(Ser) kinase/phosphatase [Clostridium sp.]|nr:HPr(Ser) kinase/phosphatase [Clostridium sp.]
MPVKVEQLVEDLGLEIILKGDAEAEVCQSDINRPGLQFSGFYSYFASERIQIVGNAEWSFLDAMRSELRRKRLKKFFKFDTPCTVVSRDLIPHDEFIEEAKLYNRWVVRTDMITTRFISKVMNYLDEKLAPETRKHGVLVDVYGYGILITGESGIGKSETALELIKRGHRLVADDAVDIKAVDGKLHGKSPYITNGMLEVRGMGIIDVPALYGLSSILGGKKIDFIIYLEQWREGNDYDRLGIDDEFIDILGVPVKKITLPIRPGRNLAVIIEAAAANYRYNSITAVSPAQTINARMDEVSKNE